VRSICKPQEQISAKRSDADHSGKRNGHGVALCKAAVFLPGRLPVIGRFSLAGGRPYVGDSPDTTRGLTILFELPEGEEWRTAMINLPVFTVPTAQGFYDQLLATALDPPDPRLFGALQRRRASKEA
jgi:catalase